MHTIANPYIILLPLFRMSWKIIFLWSISVPITMFTNSELRNISKVQCFMISKEYITLPNRGYYNLVSFSVLKGYGNIIRRVHDDDVWRLTRFTTAIINVTILLIVVINNNLSLISITCIFHTCQQDRNDETWHHTEQKWLPINNFCYLWYEISQVYAPSPSIYNKFHVP